MDSGERDEAWQGVVLRLLAKQLLLARPAQLHALVPLHGAEQAEDKYVWWVDEKSINQPLLLTP